MSLTAGTTLGPYKIIAAIGAGGMGEVYRARDNRIGRDVAVKVLPGSITEDRERLLRFESEARAAGMLNHPNLLTIFDVGTTDGAPYIVSELLEGETLRERLDKGPIPQRKAIEYALQISQGLAAAHEKNIVHRDLKPENIFILTDGRVKILDFGLAKLNPHASPEQQLGGAATEPGMVLGTVGYMSPEQVRGEQLDQRSDIFAFGTILYEMLAGGRAFKRQSSIDTLSAILREEPPDLVEINHNVSPALDRVVRRCLEKNKQLRFQSARDLAFHLESLVGATASGPRATGQHTPPAATPTEALPFAVGSMPQPVPALSTAQTATHGASPTGAVTTPPGHTATRPATATQTAVRKPMPSKTPTVAIKKPSKRETSTLMLLLAALLLLVLGGIAGYFGTQKLTKASVPSFQRVTFRRGEIHSARLAPDADTIVYSAAWEGRAPELFMMVRQNPESRGFELKNADIADISKNNELAVILNRDRLTGAGKLARMPLVGGTPREVRDNVLSAEWMPNNQDLAIIHRTATGYRLEAPIGKVLLDSVSLIHTLRITDDGSRIAFVQPNKGKFDVVMIENSAFEVLTSGWENNITGLAWAPDGKEVWFTASSSGNLPPALYAVAPGKEPRLISRLTGSLRLSDIAASGRILLTHTVWRSSMMTLAPGELTEKDLSWLDWSIAADLARDGRTILFSETREGGGAKSSVYLRKVDGSPPIRLGEGYADSISPDGSSVVAHQSRVKLVIYPTGAGEARELKALDMFEHGALFMPNGRNILIAGARKDTGYGLYLLPVDGGEPRMLTPQGTWSAANAYRPFAVSPFGDSVVALNKDKVLTIYPVNGGEPRPVLGAQRADVPIQWGSDANSIYVYQPSEIPARVFRIDMTLGTRELWKEFTPSDPAGVTKVAPVLMTPDATGYVYNVLRSLSDLYVVDGLK